MPGVAESSAVWGDYDNDGRLDILLTRYDGSRHVLTIYHNDGDGNFHEISTGLAANSRSATWGDYDNDGRLDILSAGYTADQTAVTKIYHNDGDGTFSEVLPGPISGGYSPAVWGDFDRNGQLDVLYTSERPTSYSSGESMLIYPNGSETINTAPDAPTGLKAKVLSPSSVSLSWTALGDGQTPTAGLSYSLPLGTTPGGSDIIAPSTDSNGLRRLAERGMIQGTQWTLNGLTPGKKYYWSVQVVDTGLSGSAFSSEESFVVGPSVLAVAVVEAVTPKNWTLESNEALKITWSVSSPFGIASQIVTIDGKRVTPISRPGGGSNYGCPIGALSVGTHTYTIRATDSKGITSTSTDTFTVVKPIPPAIANMVVSEAAAPKNSILESNETLKLAWTATSQRGIASQTITVDGKRISATITAADRRQLSLYYGTVFDRHSPIHDQSD